MTLSVKKILCSVKYISMIVWVAGAMILNIFLNLKFLSEIPKIAKVVTLCTTMTMLLGVVPLIAVFNQ